MRGSNRFFVFDFMARWMMVIFLPCCYLPAVANIRLPSLIADHMVLQRDKPIHIWGYANPGERVHIDFAGKKYLAITTANGKWSRQLASLKAGGPYQMTLKGENSIVLKDILIGDVWICSGQSNMEFPLSLANNADFEIDHADYPQIRLYTVDKAISLTPKNDSKGNWQLCNSQSVKEFTAVGYFFARDLQQKIKIPVGLINSSWGGTVIESWISPDGIKNDPDFSEKAANVAAFDTAAYNKVHRELHRDWVQHFNNQDKGMVDGKYIWAGEGMNEKDWKKINLPTVWEFTGYPDLWEMDGIVWFRKIINLTAEDIQTNATLNLGVIQNADEAFINGVKIGETSDIWGKSRSYIIPKSLLKTGENIITLRVENYGGDGGFTDNLDHFYLQINTQKRAIAGAWLYKIGYTLTKFDRPDKEFNPNSAPTLMYNNMISPLVNLSIKGVLWYQGESNWARAYQYRRLFPLMINDWRNQFQQGNFPFLYVQLAGYHRKLREPQLSSYWAEVREAQDLTLKTPNTGMVTAFDIGDSSNVHPKNKQEVGRRLALMAEKQVYYLPVNANGPRYASYRIAGSYVMIKIANATGGLKSKGKVAGFQIAGDDKKFYWADAEIVGKDKVKIYSPQVPHPIAVRYAWEDNPADASIYNGINLPLFPFRTDEWKGFTDDAR